MADEFFTKKVCDRCGKPLTVRTMSMFNTETICMECAEAERKRPDYETAHAAEVAAVKAGDEIVVARPGGDEIARWELWK